MMHVDLSHTPGLLYAVAYWLSSTFYIQLYGSPFSKGRKFGICAGFLALIAGFMTLTGGVSAIGFFPCMGVTVALIFFYIRIATHMPWANAGYYCARAFILGEFSASLAWYLFYFFVTVPGLPLTVWTTILVFAAVHAIILYTMFLLERKIDYKIAERFVERCFSLVIYCLLAVYDVMKKDCRTQSGIHNKQ